MKRLLFGAALLIALVVFGSMKHPHKHVAINSAPQDPVVSTAPQVTVEIRNFDFFPRELTVQTGAAVTWVNRDSVPHDATDQANGWGSGLLKQGQSVALVFDSPGVYQYHCTIHPNMTAALTVEWRHEGSRFGAAGHEVEPPHEVAHTRIGGQALQPPPGLTPTVRRGRQREEQADQGVQHPLCALDLPL